MKIATHRIVGAPFVPSPNISGALFPTGIMMHYTAGEDGDSAVNWLKQSAAGASAHLVIYPGGDKIVQMVPFNVRAWHAGTANRGPNPYPNATDIGIELVNPGFFVVSPSSPTGYVRPDVWQGVRPAVPMGVVDRYEIVRGTNPRYGSAPVGWTKYDEGQLDAAEAVVRELLRTYPAIGRITGHEDSRSDKSDPGPMFPWPRFKALVPSSRPDAPAPQPAAPQHPAGSLYAGMPWSARVIELQQSLVDEGIEVAGGVDGYYGGGTARAVAEYQKRKGWSATGVATPAVLEALGV